MDENKQKEVVTGPYFKKFKASRNELRTFKLNGKPDYHCAATQIKYPSCSIMTLA